MTSPEIKTIKRSSSRWYVDPRNGEKVIGVTSVLRMLPKPFLQYWASKVVAETAVDNLGTVMNLVTADNRAGAIDFLKRSPGRSSGAAADTGTVIHGLVERLNRGEDIGPVHPDYEPWIDNYRRFLDDWQPTFVEVEATAWSNTFGYAGTLDAICTIEGDTVLVDLKTGRGVYEATALQLSAYAHADYLLSPDGTERPIPDLDGAAVIHLRPYFYSLVPVRTDESLFEVFKALLRVHLWDAEEKRGVIGTPLTQ